MAEEGRQFSAQAEHFRIISNFSQQMKQLTWAFSSHSTDKPAAFLSLFLYFIFSLSLWLSNMSERSVLTWQQCLPWILAALFVPGYCRTILVTHSINCDVNLWTYITAFHISSVYSILCLIIFVCTETNYFSLTCGNKNVSKYFSDDSNQIECSNSKFPFCCCHFGPYLYDIINNSYLCFNIFTKCSAFTLWNIILSAGPTWDTLICLIINYLLRSQADCTWSTIKYMRGRDR